MSVREWAAMCGGLVLVAAGLQACNYSARHVASWDGKIVQYGTMHEAIGQQQHEGRVTLGEVLERPGFYGVAALEGLAGEATIQDGEVTITRVGADGSLEAFDTPVQETRATMLVGAYVPAWTELDVAENVGFEGLDGYVEEQASEAALGTTEPFVFTVTGEFRGVRIHVIHGACPLHARMHKIELPDEKKPAEVELDSARGTIVGVFAKDAVGDITHPASSTHMHLVFDDPESGERVTGHVEQLEVTAGAVLRVPATE